MDQVSSSEHPAPPRGGTFAVAFTHGVLLIAGGALLAWLAHPVEQAPLGRLGSYDYVLCLGPAAILGLVSGAGQGLASRFAPAWTAWCVPVLVAMLELWFAVLLVADLFGPRSVVVTDLLVAWLAWSVFVAVSWTLGLSARRRLRRRPR